MRGVVGKVLMTHKPSQLGMTLPQISVKAKDQETEANPPLNTSGKTKEASLIGMATSYHCHLHKA